MEVVLQVRAAVVMVLITTVMAAIAMEQELLVSA